MREKNQLQTLRKPKKKKNQSEMCIKRCRGDLDRFCLILAFCLEHLPCGVRTSEVEGNSEEEEEMVNACVCVGQYLDCEEITTSTSSIYKQQKTL